MKILFYDCKKVPSFETIYSSVYDMLIFYNPDYNDNLNIVGGHQLAMNNNTFSH